MTEDELRADLKTILSMLAEGNKKFIEADRIRKEMNTKLDGFQSTLSKHIAEEMAEFKALPSRRVEAAFKGSVILMAFCMASLVAWDFAQDRKIEGMQIGVNTMQNRIESVVEMQQTTVNVLSYMRHK
jgi:hypothetical protein